jgi:mono/diheme cytochrome c family protein
MSDPKPEKKVKPPRAFGWMAEYTDDNQLLDAARKVRDSGYSRTDAFTPFPVHGIDEALGIKPTVLPWFTLVAGATGTITALTMEYWMNAVDYMYIISGKPYASWPAFIPVAFELTVLFAAFTTVFAMLGLNGLPRFSNPVFANPRFDRATDDRFFLWVDSRDKYFNSEKVKSLLESTHPHALEEVREDETEAEVPRPIWAAILVLVLVALIPGAIVLRMRSANSNDPRWQVFFDMDFQPKKKPQQSTTLFADGRAQRMPVPGTIARGDLELADPFYLGYDPEKTAALELESKVQLVSFQDAAAPVAAAQPAAGAQPAAAAQPAAGEPNFAWLTDMPVEVNDELFALGKKKFETNCSVCHGFGGYGDGLVSKRATNLGEDYWLPPTSLHDDRVQKQTVGRLYYTVTNGKGKMAGYASALTPRERWAIVAYVRALQRSQNASMEDVPETRRGELSKK